uniref:Uncharacterized protein n=1 Tax=Oryza rufipogon TaxID=4529 RepID=A0A0E0RDR6_ORYRU
MTISPRSSSPRKSQKPIRSTERWRENVWWFWDSVGGDRKAIATPQVITGNPFGIKPSAALSFVGDVPSTTKVSGHYFHQLRHDYSFVDIADSAIERRPLPRETWQKASMN